ncbi:MAG: hypothetical protein NTV73_05705 [Hyphomicrobiales bacterium]|nr:hypothetical protein [Hyphomicrobiales bacterium]
MNTLSRKRITLALLRATATIALATAPYQFTIDASAPGLSASIALAEGGDHEGGGESDHDGGGESDHDGGGESDHDGGGDGDGESDHDSDGDGESDHDGHSDGESDDDGGADDGDSADGDDDDGDSDAKLTDGQAGVSGQKGARTHSQRL